MEDRTGSRIRSEWYSDMRKDNEIALEAIASAGYH